MVLNPASLTPAQDMAFCTVSLFNVALEDVFTHEAKNSINTG